MQQFTRESLQRKLDCLFVTTALARIISKKIASELLNTLLGILTTTNINKKQKNLSQSANQAAPINWWQENQDIVFKQIMFLEYKYA